MSKNKDLLASVSDILMESEFPFPMPANYKNGKTHYVFAMGTVTSGLGKVKHICDGIDTPEQYAEFVKRYKRD